MGWILNTKAAAIAALASMACMLSARHHHNSRVQNYAVIASLLLAVLAATIITVTR